MKKGYAFLALLSFLVLGFAPQKAWAQFNTGTITLDGAASEPAYITGVGGNRANWSMAWDDTYLYLRVNSGAANEPVIFHIDIDPQSPVDGGTNANGSLVGQTNFNITPTLPFRSDYQLYWEGSYAEYRTDNGSGGWSGITTIPTPADRSNGTTNREIRLAWTTMGLSARPAAFNWLGYSNSTGSFIFNQVPDENPSAGGSPQSPTLNYYWTVSSTANNSSITAPFARKSYESRATATMGLVATTFYDYTLNAAAATTHTFAPSGTITVNNQFYLGNNNTFQPQNSGGARTLAFTGITGSAPSLSLNGANAVLNPNNGGGNDLSINCTAGATTITGDGAATAANCRIFNLNVSAGATVQAPSTGTINLGWQFGTISVPSTGILNFVNGSGVVNLINTGGSSVNFNTPAGSSCTLNNLTNNAGGILQNTTAVASTVNIRGNFSNLNVTADAGVNAGNGGSRLDFVFNGTAAQTISTASGLTLRGLSVTNTNAGAVTYNSAQILTISGTAPAGTLAVAANAKLIIAPGAATAGALTLATGALTNINGAIQLNGAGLAPTIVTNGNLTFNTGSTYEHNFTTVAGTIPTATWAAGSTCSIGLGGTTGYTTNATAPAGLGQNFSNFTWNCPNQTGASLINLAGGLGAGANIVGGTFTVTSTGAGRLELTNAAQTIALNAITQTGGLLYLTNAGTATVNVAGTGGLQLSGGTFGNITSGTSSIVFNGGNGVSQTFAIAGNTMSGTGTLNFTAGNGTNTNTVALSGNVGTGTAAGTVTAANNATLAFGTSVLSGSGAFTANASSILSSANTNGTGAFAAGAAGSVQVLGTRTYTAGHSLILNGTGTAQSAGTVVGGGTTPSLGILTISNNSGASLAAATTITGLTFTAGILDIGTHNLTYLSGTTTGATAARYIQTSSTGTLIRTVGASAVTFPIGNAAYNPLTITNTGTSDTYAIRVLDAAQPNALDNTRVINRHWAVTEGIAGGGSLSPVVAQYNGADARGANFNTATTNYVGLYDASWQQQTASLAGADPFTFTTGVALVPTGATYALAIGRDGAFITPPTTYTWIGSASSSWGTPANWTPGTSTAGPVAVDNVVIPTSGSYTNALVLTASQACNDFTLQGTGVFTVNASQTLTLAGAITTTGASGAPTLNGGVAITSATAQNVPTWTYFDLALNNANHIFQAGNNFINGALTFTGGTPVASTTNVTISFSGTGSQPIPALTYFNLTIGGARVSTPTITLASGTITVTNIFSTTGLSGAYTVVNTGNTLVLNTASALTIPVFQYNNLTATGGARTLANGIIDIAGTYTPSAGATTVGSSTVRFVATTGGPYTLPAQSSGYNNLTVNAGGIVYNLASGVTLAVAGNYVHGGGTFNLNPNAAAGGMSVTGSYTQTAGTVVVNSGSNTGTLTVTGATNLSAGTGTITVASAGTGNLTLAGLLNVGASASLQQTGGVATLLFNNASATQNWTQASTIAGALTVQAGTGSTTNRVQVQGDVNMGASASTALIVQNGSTIDFQGFVVTGSGIFTQNGGGTPAVIRTANAAGFSALGTNTGSIQLTAARNYNNSGGFGYTAQTGTPSMGNAIFSALGGTLSATGFVTVNTGVGIPLSMPSSPLTLTLLTLTSGTFAPGNGNTVSISSAGTITGNGGTMASDATGGTVNFAGAGTIAGTTSANFFNLTVGSGNNVTLTRQPTVFGTATITSTGTFATQAPVYGSGATLAYTSAAGQTANALDFPAASGPTNLSKGGAGTLSLPFTRTLAGNLSVLAGDLRNSSGAGITLTLSGATATLNAVGTINGTNVGAGNDINLVVSGTTTVTGGSGTLIFLNVTVNASASLLIARANFEQRFGGFTVGNASTLQFNSTGTLAATSNSPTYNALSTLVYNQGATPNRGLEWTGTAGAGYPGNINIINGSNLSLNTPAGNIGLAGNLSLGDAATSGSLTMGTMAASTGLVVGGNLTIGATGGPATSTLTLSTTTTSPAIKVAGNWTRNANGAFVSNTRGVFLNGAVNQTINSNAGAIFDFLLLTEKTAGTVELASDVTVQQVLSLPTATNVGIINANGFTVAVTNTATAAIVGGYTGSFVNGALRRTLAANLSGASGTFSFPVGNAAYLPFTMVNPVTGATGPVIGVQATSGSVNGGSTTLDATLVSLNTSEFWQMTVPSGNYTSGTLNLTRQVAVPATNVMAYSSAAAGTYTNQFGTVSSTTVNGVINAATAPGFYVMAVPAPAPTIASVVPTSLSLDFTQGNSTGYIGQNLTITGTSFTGATVTIGGQTATITSNTGTVIVVPVPNNAATGSVVVTNPSAQSAVVSFTGMGYITQAATDYDLDATWLGGLKPTAASTLNHTVRHSVGITSGIASTPDSITVIGGGQGTLASSGASSITINRGLKNRGTVTITAGAITFFGTGFAFANAGSFTASGGFIYQNGSATYTGNAATLQYLQLTGAGTTTFNTAPTINGTFSIANASAVVAGSAPTYGTTATLEYTHAGARNRGQEWTAASAAGYPGFVSILGGATLNLNTPAANLGVRTDLSLGDAISSGSLNMGATAFGLFVGGSTTIGASGGPATSTLTLSSNGASPAIKVGGNWTRNTNGAFVSNGRGVFLNGATTQAINSAGGAQFDFLLLTEKTAGGVTLNSNVTVTSQLALPSVTNVGIINVNGQTLLVSGTAATAVVGGYTGSYVNGQLQRALPANAAGAGGLYSFPVGTASAYLPYTLNNPTTGAAAPTLTVQAVAGQVNATPAVDGTLLSLDNTEYWLASNTGNYTNGTVSITRQAAVTAGSVIARSAAAAGTYTGLGGTVAGTTITGTTNNTGNTLGYFLIGTPFPAPTIASITSILVSGAAAQAGGGYIGQQLSIVGTNFPASPGLTVTVGGQSVTYTGSGTTITTSAIPATATGATVVVQNAATLASASIAFTNLGFISIASTAYTTGTTWLGLGAPLASRPVTIKDAVTLNATANTATSVTVTSTGSLTFLSNVGALGVSTLSNAGTVDMTAGGILTLAGGGSFANTGTFTAFNSGTPANSGAVQHSGSVTYTGSASALLYNLALTAGGSIATFTNPPTINGIFSVSNATATVAGSGPIYATGSTLRYNSGTSPHPRTQEWSATSGAGFPANVLVTNNTGFVPAGDPTLSYPLKNTALQLSGNLQVDAGSGFFKDWGGLSSTSQATSTVIGGNLQLDGSMSLSLNAGANVADLFIGGNFVRSGTFNATGIYGRNIFLNGTAAQSITGTAFSVDRLTIFNTVTAPAGVTLGVNLTVNTRLRLTSGLFILGNSNLTIGTAGDIDWTTASSATSYIVTNGTGTLTGFVNNSVVKEFPIGPTTSKFGYVGLRQAGTAENITLRAVNVPILVGTANDSSFVVKTQYLLTESVAGANSLITTIGWTSISHASNFAPGNAMFLGNANGAASYAYRAGNATIGSGPFFVTNAAPAPLTATFGANFYLVAGNFLAFEACFASVAGSGLEWNNTATWAQGAIPLANSPVCINGNVVVTSTGGNPVTSGLIQLNTGGSLTISAAQAVTVNNGGIANGTGSVQSFGAGTIEFIGTNVVSGGNAVTFSNLGVGGNTNFSPNPTVTSQLIIRAGGFILSGLINYGAASTLVYNTGNTYGRFNEWSTTSGAGYPTNVLVTGNTILNVRNGADIARAISGNLQVDNGSTLSLQTMNVNLTAGGNVTLNGAIILSSVSGGDLVVGRNWNSGSTASLTPNGRDVRFNSGAFSQSITNTASGLQFGLLTIDNTSAGVTLATNITASTFRVNSGRTFSLGNTNKLIIAAGGSLQINNTGVFNGDTGTIEYTNGGSFNNDGTFNYGRSTINYVGGASGTVGGSVKTSFFNIFLFPTGGINFNTGALRGELYGTLELRSGSFVTNPPTYMTGSKLRFAGGGVYNRNTEWDNGSLKKVELSNNTQLYLGGNSNVNVALPATMADSLIVNTGSQFNMTNMTASANVGGSLALRGTLTMSLTAGSDLYLGGDWVNNGGTFTSNDRVVFFNGATNAALKGPTTTTFPFATINKDPGRALTLQNTVQFTRPGGTALRIQGGTFDLGGFSVGLNAGSTLRIDSGYVNRQTLRTSGTDIGGFTNYRRSTNPVDSLGGKVEYSGSYAPVALDKGFNILSIVNGTTLTTSNTLRVADSLIVGATGILDFSGAVNVLARGNVFNQGVITANNGAEVQLIGNSVQALAGSGSYGRLRLNNAAGATSANMPTITTLLTIQRGKLTSGTNPGDTLLLGSSGVLTETITDAANQHFVRGAIKTVRPVGAGSGNSNFFGGLGVGLTTGADNLGNVTVVRFSGIAVNGQNPSTCCTAHQSIRRYWKVKPAIQPTAADRDAVFLWPSQDDNTGQIMTAVTLWKSTDGIAPYDKFGDIQNSTTAIGSSAHIRAGWLYNISSFSFITLADEANFLPLGLLRFTGANVRGTAQLAWTITNEKNWAQFTLERSADGKNFGPIATVRSEQNSRASNAYTYADKAFTRNSYYRLRLIDTDGKTEVSKAVYITLDNAVARAISIFPNPATSAAALSIDGQTDLQEGLHIDMIGMDGRILYSLDGTLQEVNQELQSRIRAMPLGVYQVRILLSDSQKMLKFVKD